MAKRDSQKKALLAQGFTPEEVDAYYAERDARPSSMTGSIRGPSGSLEPDRDDAGPAADSRLPLRQPDTIEGFTAAQAHDMGPMAMLSPDEQTDLAINMGSNIVGLATGGAGGALLRAATPALRGIPALLARAGTAAGEGYIGGAAQEGTSSAARGDSAGDVLAKAHQGGKLGAALGAGGQAVGEVFGGGKKLIGMASDHITKRAASKAAGVYDRPDIKNLPSGEEGVQKVGEQSLQKIINRDQELGQQASRAYHERVTPELGKPIDRRRMIGEIEARRAFETLDPDTGLPLNDRVTRTFDEAIDKTGPKPLVEGTLARRRALKEDASFDSPAPTDAQKAKRKVYQAFRGAVRRAAPEVGAADDAYAASAEQAARRRDILFNTEDNVLVQPGGLPEGVPTEHADDLLAGRPQTIADDLAAAESRPRVAKERSASTTLSRAGDTNVPGLRAKRYIEELAAQDPAFAAAIDEIAAKKALEGTQPSLRGLIADDLKGAVFGGGFGPVIRQNARSIGYGAHQTADAASKIVPEVALNPLTRAAIADRERQKRLADALKSRTGR